MQIPPFSKNTLKHHHPTMLSRGAFPSHHALHNVSNQHQHHHHQIPPFSKNTLKNHHPTMLSRGAFPSYHALSNHHHHQAFIKLNPHPIRKQNNSISIRSNKISAVLTGDPAVESHKPSLADRLRLGSLTEDGLSYKEKFIVRCYEVGINKTATVETIANLLQEVGGNHAQSVGFSTDGFATTPTMRKLNLIWVTARMHIEIYKYPAWSDVVEIETWCQGEGRIGTRRDWIMKDCATGEVIGRATSKWVMMNHNTRRLQKVSDEVRNEVLIFCPIEPRLSFPEENNASMKKISKLEDPAAYSKIALVPRRADLDMNHHVNNVTYIGWVLESVPQRIIDSHELQSITLDYRRECQEGDVVDSLTSPEPSEAAAVAQLDGCNGSASAAKDGNKSVNFLHFLRLSPNGLEINRGRTEWRKKPAKR